MDDGRAFDFGLPIEDATEWGDSIEDAYSAAARLLEMTEGDWEKDGLHAVSMLRRRRPDSPLLLAVTAAALHPDPQNAAAELTDVLTELSDTEWPIRIAESLAGVPSVGVASLGDATRKVLSAFIAAEIPQPEVVTDRRAIARGLEFLSLAITVGPPEGAAALLLPALATHGQRVWTSPAAADLAHRAATGSTLIVPVLHPLSRLTTLNRRAFRPAGRIVDVELI